MTGEQPTGKKYSGRCKVCGVRFVYMDLGEYKSAVARHIVDNHRDQPPDKPIVVPEGGVP